MSLESDIDTTMATLKTNVASYLTAGRPAHVLADWLLSQIRQFDNAIHRRLVTNASTVLSTAPDTRTLAAADNVG